jgi:glycosyltransferase involved in cell wall biosynthesis
MRILFLSTWFPSPPDNGSRQRVFNVLRSLAAHHEVTLVSSAYAPEADRGAPVLTTLCRRIEVFPIRPFAPSSWRARVGYLQLAPRSIIDTYSEEMAQRVRTVVATERYDLVVASQLLAASYVPSWGAPPALYEEVELGLSYEQFARAPSLLQRGRRSLTWLKHRLYLARLLRSFRACTVVSERERQLLDRAAPQHPPVTIIPNAVNLPDYADVHETPRPNQLIFAGSLGYSANYDAMCWFMREVYPLIRARVPDVQLTITGGAANRSVPAAPNVLHTGYVDDVRPLVAGAWISVVPIRMGGGTRVKILEAMALGTPVVATSKGAEGLDVTHDTHLLIADAPCLFAEHVLRLLRDADLRNRLAQNARELVAQRYSWGAIGPRFAQLAVETARSTTDS